MKVSSGLTFRLFLLSICIWCSCAVTKTQVVSHHAVYIPIDSTTTPDPQMEAMLQPYRKAMDSIMNEVIGYSDMPLTKAQPECTIGNFMADAQLQYAQHKYADTKISIINYGSIRLPYLAPGGISKAMVFEMMPFDNMVTIVAIPGKTLKQFCNHIAEDGGWPVSGITFTIKEKKATDILVNKEPVNDQLIYKAVMPDYVANGGDDCDFLQPCKKEYLSVFTRDLLMDYIRALQSKNEKLHVNIEKRISYAE
jgi:2',3'-cyclic-nucleotide 2'-phosphodiesterase (5'-nucleotidase family)